MSEALKSLNNIRTLRAQGRELPLEVLEEILEKLNVIVGVLGIFRPKTTKCSGGRAVRGLQRGITFR